MYRQRLKKSSGGILLALGLFAVAAAFSFLSPLWVEELENRSWDWRLRIVADPARADKRIKLIVVDQPSLDFLEREYSLTWPVPRDAYAHIISFLTASGAKGLAFDVLFTESSAQAVESDRVFAEASGGPLPVVHAVNLETYEKYIREEKFELFKARQLRDDAPKRWRGEFFGGRAPKEYRSISLPIPELIETSRALGSVHAAPDSDGVYRRYQAGGAFRGVPVLGLPFALLNATGGKPGPAYSSFLDESARAVVRLHGAGGVYPTYSFAAVLQAEAARAEGNAPDIPLDVFRDSWVILGTTAPGLLDLRPTPLHERGNGIEFVAATFDNLLHDDFIKRPTLEQKLLLSLLLIALTIGTTLWVEQFTVQVLTLLLTSAVFITFTLRSAEAGAWMPFVVPLTSGAVAAFLGVTVRYQLEGKQLKFIRRAFQYYISPTVVNRLVDDPELLALGGEKRELTMFFSDIVNFTALSEKMDPTMLVSLLNEYLSLMSDTIQSHGGTVDKYVGDAVVAFWNAPLEVADHPIAAVEAAIACQRKLAERAPAFREEFGAELVTRMGIHTAVVTVGNFGSLTRFDYTMIGDGTNLASRLEGMNKYFGTLLLISGATQKSLVGRIETRKIADIRVSGKEETVRMFEPYIDARQTAFAEGNLDHYIAGLAAFEAGEWESAEQHFAKLPDDPVSRAYLRRMKDLSTEKMFLGSWSPIWEFTEK